jgi:tripartite-type tricarboxylate transporter receptor subunit TctC
VHKLIVIVTFTILGLGELTCLSDTRENMRLCYWRGNRQLVKNKIGGVNMKITRGSKISMAAMALSVAIVAQPANADTVSEFYSKTNLMIVVGYSPGGGADLFARFLARHIGKHLPGKPNVIVQNMPGSGGIKALNHFYKVGAQDGSRTILTSATHTLAQLLGRKKIRYDVNKMQWLGTLTQDTPSCVIAGRTGIKSITEAKDRQIIFGATGANSSSNQHPLLMRDLLGYKIKIVTGYKGTAKVRLAINTGEVDAVCSFWASQALGPLASQIKSGDLVPIVQFGTQPNRAFGNAPVIYSLARNDEERLIMRAVFKPTELTRPYGTAPGAPADRVAALRKGFWSAVNSPELQADAKRIGLIVDPLDYKQTLSRLAELFKTPKSTIAKVKKTIRVK